MSERNQPAPKVSERFNSSDSDVTIWSCDNMIFKLHKKYLEANTGAFPPAETPTLDEVVSLTETADILELLFQFTYPQRHPSLASIEFETLAALAEAAEKYEVFSAMDMCAVWMERAIPSHVAEILVYAAKHDYHSMLNQVAPLALALPPNSVIDLLPVNILIPWTRYYNQVSSILFTAISQIDNGTGESAPDYCSNWHESISRRIMIKMAEGVGALLKLDKIAAEAQVNATCGHTNCVCRKAPVIWRDRVQRAFDDVGTFGTFMSSH